MRGNMDWCGTTDIRSLFWGCVFMLLMPFIGLYLVGNYLYCRITGKVFLEVEQRELEEARERPPIILGGKG